MHRVSLVPLGFLRAAEGEARGSGADEGERETTQLEEWDPAAGFFLCSQPWEGWRSPKSECLLGTRTMVLQQCVHDFDGVAWEGFHGADQEFRHTCGVHLPSKVAVPTCLWHFSK
jgi:hypothetical protein